MEERKQIQQIQKKIHRMMEKIDPTQPLEPRSQTVCGRYTDQFETFFRPNWTYSFYLGQIILLYEYTKEERYLDYPKQCKQVYTDFLFHNEAEIGHDTGFLYSLYAVPMARLTGDEVYRMLALKAADEVAKRFRTKSGHIQAFFDLRQRGVQDRVSLMIADDMMNMNLIMWAYQETGHSFYRDVYENHIATSVRYLIREDYSTRHAYHFDVTTGQPMGEMNYCGYGIGSHWSRGTAWIIYGLTKALKFTGNDERYRFALEGVFEKYLDALEKNPIPPWDFRCNEDQFYDTSAAAIVASASLDMQSLDIHERLAKRGAKYVDDVVTALNSELYQALEDAEHLIVYEKGEGTLWGDYFYTELVMKQLLGAELPDMWLA